MARTSLAPTRTGPNRIRTSVVAALVAALTLSAGAQSRIEPDDNRFSPEQDVELGQQAAREVRQQLPLLRDETTTSFVEEIGDRLVAEIPEYLQQPAFRYSFEVVNLREINAFALPGGPMFLHRGMIEAARTDGEVAGVMAHELSHVILRHGTAQATKGQKFQIGAIAGQVLGAIVGGGWGDVISQGSQIGLGVYFLKYGREYEREADLLGAQIMARAGYDPRQMASMFQTIEKQGGSGGPEWLSSHPNPGNRHEAIIREAESLQVQGQAPRGRIEQVHARLDRMSPAPTSEQVARGRRGGSGPVGTSGRTMRVEPPSRQWQTVQPGDFLRLSVPSNWRQVSGGGGTVTYAPEGGYVQARNGQSAFTHGVELGVVRTDGGSLQQSTDELLQAFARANPQLRRQGGYSRTTIGGRRGLTTTLSNVSDVTGEREAVNVSTVQLSDGSVLFLLGVAPSDEARTYFDAFSRVRQSVQLNDR
ncbi:MAG TPA: M48 family metallopeptidase [Vicinamibacterales bacterium]|nr:M48 family metallopeptidase [Vicinamibacterales bacterium]